MSSSSSIAAARRRRAGGPPGPTPPGSNSSRPSPNNTPNRQPEPPAGPVNPLILLQQHHVKITMMEQVLKDLVSKQELSKNDVSKNAQVSAQVNAPVAANRQMTEQPTPSQLNINELSDLIMSRMEAQLDLKAFYENDEKLMTEIEELKSVVQSQQMVINSLNTAVFSLISKLNVSIPTNIVSELDADDADAADGNATIDSANADDEVGSVFKSEVDTNSNQDLNSSNVREGLTPTFPKSVMINETNNTIKEFKNDFDEVQPMVYDNSNLTY